MAFDPQAALALAQGGASAPPPNPGGFDPAAALALAGGQPAPTPAKPEYGNSRARAQKNAPTITDMLQFISGSAAKAEAGLAGLPVDTALNAWDLGKAGVGTAQSLLTGRPPSEMFDPTDRAGVYGSSQSIINDMRKQGSIAPGSDPTSKGGELLDQALQGGFSSVLGGGLIGPREALNQFAGGAAAAGVSDIIQQAGGDPSLQVLGSMLPNQVGQAKAALGENGRRRAIGEGPPRAPQDELRRRMNPLYTPKLTPEEKAWRTGDTQTYRNLRESQAAGITHADPAAITGNKSMALTEATLGRLPGAGAIMDKAATQRAEDVGRRVQGIGQSLSPNKITQEQAGGLIQQGAEAQVPRMKKLIDMVYRPFDRMVPATTPIKLDNYMRAVDNMAGRASGVEELSAAHTSDAEAKVKAGADAFLARTGGVAPFSGVQQLRSKLGEQFVGGPALEKLTPGQVRELYKALSDDIRESLPSDKARKQWDQANAYTKSVHDQYETVYKPLIDKGTPEKAFTAAFQGTKEGASSFRKIMGGLKPAERDAVAAHVIEQMGKQTPGKQNAEGDKFSSEQFFARWQKMHPDARDALIPSPQVRKDLQTVISAVDKLKGVGEAAYNSSGTARAVTYAGMAGGVTSRVIDQLFHLNVGSAASTIAQAYTELRATGAAAKLYTNPEFVKWLAEGVKRPEVDGVRFAARLSDIARNSKDPEQQAVLAQLAAQAQPT